MDKEKEIQEMAKNMCSSYAEYCGCGCRVENCPIDTFAKNAIDAGYRKADEVRKETAEKIWEKVYNLIKNAKKDLTSDTIIGFAKMFSGVEVKE